MRGGPREDSCSYPRIPKSQWDVGSHGPNGAAEFEFRESAYCCLLGTKGLEFRTGLQQGSRLAQTREIQKRVSSLPALVKTAIGKHLLELIEDAPPDCFSLAHDSEMLFKKKVVIFNPLSCLTYF